MHCCGAVGKAKMLGGNVSLLPIRIPPLLGIARSAAQLMGTLFAYLTYATIYEHSAEDPIGHCHRNVQARETGEKHTSFTE